MPPRIPTEEDFAPIASSLPHKLHFPNPPESTVAILVVFHGLGDNHQGFSTFAEGMNLPGVLAITVRGTSALPPSLLPEELAAGGPDGHPGFWHWGDDLTVNEATGDIDEDPGFTGAETRIMDTLIKGVLLDKCGWELSDILFFGFGQGGSLALGLASRLRAAPRVEEVTDDDNDEQSHRRPRVFKGIVSLGGPLPASMVPIGVAEHKKSDTRVLVCQLGDDAVDGVKKEFEHVTVVNWQLRGLHMPGSREEMVPLMKFFAERLNPEA
jgi:predicted esterase